MRRARSLRLRLVLIVAALLAAVAAIIGVVSVTVLQDYLVGQVDKDVSDSANRASRGLDHDWVPGGGFVLGQVPGTVIALVAGGKVASAGYLDQYGQPQTLPAGANEDAILELIADGRPHTVDLGKNLGEYRMVAAVDQARTQAVVTGLPLSGVQNTARQLGTIVLIVTAAGLLLAGAAAWITVGAALRPLRRVAQTATTVAELPLDRDADISVRVPEKDTDQSTEVGRVGAALNLLLGHVGTALAVRKASEDRMRQFVGDASHELRTPLASIRGYSELTRRTQTDLPDEVRHSLSRIESEAIRMTSLVEDLLLLARLDSRRELEREEVDLSRVMLEAVGDAHVAGPDHEWELDLPDEPVVAQGDEARLRQVVVNLLANARVHTPAGTTVTAGLAEAEDGTVTIRVADDGPGIDPKVMPTLFERFSRGDASRQRATGTTGLGLSIVRGVVEAHGGEVRVESTPGSTVFTVTLPPAPAAAAATSAPTVAAGEPASARV